MKAGKFLQFSASAFFVLIVASCSNMEEGNLSPPRTNSSESIVSLTERLSEYGKGFDVVAEGSMKAGGNAKITKNDIAKIAIADAKGAIRGSRGGWKGALVGAAVFSAIKTAQVLAEKNGRAHFAANAPSDAIVDTGGVLSREDSIGYLHNYAEAAVYVRDNACHEQSATSLVDMTDGIVSSVPGYAGSLSVQDRAYIAQSVDRLRTIDSSGLSFADYCASLKESEPEDAESIDFTAQYIYTVIYTNADAVEYTRHTLNAIAESGLAHDEALTLERSIRIAYASIVQSRGMIQTTQNDKP